MPDVRNACLVQVIAAVREFFEDAIRDKLREIWPPRSAKRRF
jgi:hypothetical protein